MGSRSGERSAQIVDKRHFGDGFAALLITHGSTGQPGLGDVATEHHLPTASAVAPGARPTACRLGRCRTADGPRRGTAPDQLLAGVAELEVADHIPAGGEDVLLDAGSGLLCV